MILGAHLLSGSIATADNLGFPVAMLATSIFVLIVQVPVGLAFSLILDFAPSGRGVALASTVVWVAACFLAIVAAFFNLAGAMVGGNAHYPDAQAFTLQSLAGEWPVYVVAIIASVAGGMTLHRIAKPAR